MSALSSRRTVTVTIGVEAMDINAIKAVASFVENHEASYARNTATPDIGVPATTTAVTVLLSDVTPYKIFVFNV